MSPSSTADDVSPLSLRNDVAPLRSAMMRCLPLTSRRTHHARRAHHCRMAASFARKGKHHFEPWMGERKRPDLAFSMMSPSSTANDVSPLPLRNDVASLRSAMMRCLPLTSRRTHHARRAHHCRKQHHLPEGQTSFRALDGREMKKKRFGFFNDVAVFDG